MSFSDSFLVVTILLVFISLFGGAYAGKTKHGGFSAAVGALGVVLFFVLSLKWAGESWRWNWLEWVDSPARSIPFAVASDPVALIFVTILLVSSIAFVVFLRVYSSKEEEQALFGAIPVALLGGILASLAEVALVFFVGMGILLLASHRALKEDAKSNAQALFAQKVFTRSLVGLIVSILAWTLIESRSVVLGPGVSYRFEGDDLGLMTLSGILLALGLLLFSGIVSWGPERDEAPSGLMRWRWLVTDVFPSTAIGFHFFEWGSFFEATGIFEVLGPLLCIRSLYCWLVVLLGSGVAREQSFLRAHFSLSLGAGMIGGADGVWVGVVASSLSSLLYLILISLLNKGDKEETSQGSGWSILPLVGFIGFMPSYLLVRAMDVGYSAILYLSMCLLALIAALSSWRLVTELGPLRPFGVRKVAWISFGILAVFSTILFWTGRPLGGVVESSQLWFFSLENFVSGQTYHGSSSVWSAIGYLQGSVLFGAMIGYWLRKRWKNWKAGRSLGVHLEDAFGLTHLILNSGRGASRLIYSFDLWQSDRIFGRFLHDLRIVFVRVYGRFHNMMLNWGRAASASAARTTREQCLRVVTLVQRRDDQWYLTFSLIGLAVFFILINIFGGSA